MAAKVVEVAKNGSLQRYLSYAAAIIAVLSFSFALLWRVFTLTSAVEQQAGINSELLRRVGALEGSMANLQGDAKALIGDVRVLATRLDSGARRVDDLDTKLSELQLASAKIGRDLNEIETQFCASDNIRNLTHASDVRTMAALFEKVFGQRLDISNAFYPRVCNRLAQ